MVGMDKSAQGLGPERERCLSVHTETRRGEKKVQNRGNVFAVFLVCFWVPSLLRPSAVRAAVLL